MNYNDPSPQKPQQGGARDFLAVLFRRRWIIGSVFGVTTVAVLAINLSQPMMYESTGKVILKRGVKDSIMQGYTRTLTWEEELASEVETVKSGAVVQRAQKILDDTRAAAGRPTLHIAQNRVDASVVGESNVIAMSYQDRNPETARDVTDALIHGYMDYRKSAYTLAYPKEFFETEIARVTADLDQVVREKETYMRETGTVNLGIEGSADASFMQQQQLVLADVERDLAQMRTRVANMQEFADDPAQPGELPFIASDNVGNDGVAVDLKRKLSEARVRLKEMESVYVPQSRELQQQKAEVDHLTSLLTDEIKSRVKLSTAELRSLEARRAQVLQSIGEGRARMSTYPARTARLADYDTRIGVLQKNYEELQKSSEQAKISKATSPDWTVALLTPASAPYAKNQRDYVRLALAPIFSLIVGLGLAFFIDGLDSTLKNPREAEEALELPVLASLTEQRRRRA